VLPFGADLPIIRPNELIDSRQIRFDTALTRLSMSRTWQSLGRLNAAERKRGERSTPS